MCWGLNGNGQLGNNSVQNSAKPVAAPNITTAIAVSAGMYHTCAVEASTSALYCWGFNGNGELGNNSTSQKLVPTITTGSPQQWTDVSAGVSMTCGVGAGGSYCWGKNDVGQLGYNSLGANCLVPILVFGGDLMVKVNAWGSTGCAVKNGYIPVCWGAGDKGQIGNGSTTAINLMPYISNVPGGKVTSIVSSGQHVCATVPDSGQLYCWGSNENGSLGIGESSGIKTTPELVPLQPLTLSAKGDNTLAIVPVRHSPPTSGLVAWGSNQDRQLGTGVYNPAYVDVPVSIDLPNVYEVAAGAFFSCALADPTEQALYCWGLNNFAQLGLNFVSVNVAVPYLVSNSVAAVSPGYRHACLVYNADLALPPRCWGDNSWGQLGNGGTELKQSPFPISVLTSAQAISAGLFHSCALETNTRYLYCWGDNTYGQLGNGTYTRSLVPARISTRVWDEVVAGSNMSCGVST
ncbi:hypothetical protein H632_c1944p0, partial [Helicosporidium sp. ATCC 50920]